MDITVNAINLKSFDFGESDKICVLYSIELGKFTAICKGVKKAASKLKFAAEPFCFGEYSLSKTKDRYIVTGCVLDTQFYDIRLDIGRYYAGCAVLECIEHCSLENVKSPALFLLVLKTLKSLTYENDSPEKILAFFILNAIKILGYKLSLDKCVNCGNILADKIYFSSLNGGFTCGLCRDGIPSSKIIHTALRLLSLTDYEKLGTLKLGADTLRECLKLLNFYFNNCTGNTLKVLAQYLSQKID